MSDSNDITPEQAGEVFAEGRIQIGFDVVELQRVSLQPGDALMVTVKNDDMDHASMNALRSALKDVFPDNKIFVFGMGTADDVKLSIIGQESVAKTENVGYCNNCNCGKKERAEQTLEGESDGRSQPESSGEGTCGNQCSGGCSER
jgi:hypothetical protein